MMDHVFDVTDEEGPKPPRRQTLGYTKRDLPNEVLAIIRLSWYKKGRPHEIDEFQVMEDGQNGFDAFVAAVSNAIQCGADVTVICSLPPEEFGLEP